MIKYTIDRFEGDYVVVQNKETGEIKNILVVDVPTDVAEGDTLVFTNNVYTIDHEETRISREEIQKLMEELRK